MPSGTFERLLVLDPTNGLAHQNVASMRLRQALAARDRDAARGRMEQAESFARKALEIDPGLAGAHTVLGVVLSETGRKPEAIDNWKRAVAIDATEFNALYNLWLELASAGRRDEAVAYGRQFIATAPPAFFGSERQQIARFLGGG